VRTVWTIAKRELGATFATPIGWVCLCSLLVMTGLFFAWMLGLYAETTLQAAYSPWDDPINVNDYLVVPFFGNWAVILLFVCPALTMRQLAEERRSGSLELLLTSPVSATQIVLGKFLGVMGFIAVMMACTLHYPAFLCWLGSPDMGVIVASYLSTLVLAAAYVSVGLLASAMTRNQVVALLLSFALLLGLWLMGASDPSTGGVANLFSQISLLSHCEAMGKGVLQWSDLVYFAGFVSLFLFATQQRIETMRWD